MTPASSAQNIRAINSKEFYLLEGRKRVNLLGGVSIQRKPIPNHVRLEITRLAVAGMRNTAISKQLKVSRTSVSRILYRYQETGSIQSVKQRKSNYPVATTKNDNIIKECKRVYPANFSLKIQDPMVKEGNYDKNSSLSDAEPSFCINKTDICDLKNQTDHSINKILNGDAMDYVNTGSGQGTSFRGTYKRARTVFTMEQKIELNKTMKMTMYPDYITRNNLAQQTGLTDAQVLNWFKVKRASQRKAVGKLYALRHHQLGYKPMPNSNSSTLPPDIACPTVSSTCHLSSTASPLDVYYGSGSNGFTGEKRQSSIRPSANHRNSVANFWAPSSDRRSHEHILYQNRFMISHSQNGQSADRPMGTWYGMTREVHDHLPGPNFFNSPLTLTPASMNNMYASAMLSYNHHHHHHQGHPN